MCVEFLCYGDEFKKALNLATRNSMKIEFSLCVFCLVVEVKLLYCGTRRYPQHSTVMCNAEATCGRALQAR